ncbi:hypothetical protein BaRGS_00014801, partial [Batillaria attramentaria]
MLFSCRHASQPPKTNEPWSSGDDKGLRSHHAADTKRERQSDRELSRETIGQACRFAPPQNPSRLVKLTKYLCPDRPIWAEQVKLRVKPVGCPRGSTLLIPTTMLSAALTDNQVLVLSGSTEILPSPGPFLQVFYLTGESLSAPREAELIWQAADDPQALVCCV